MLVYKSDDVYAVEDYSYEHHEERLLGVIRKDYEGYWVFAPGRKVEMTCKQLRTLSEKISKLNTGGEME